MRYCTHCGAAVEETHFSCPSCGQALKKEQTPSKTPAWVKGLLTCLILAIFIYGFWVVLTPDPIEIVENQAKAIQAAKYTEAYYDYTAPEFQKETSLDQFKTFLKDYPALFDVKTMQLTNRQLTDGNIQNFWVLFTSEKGEKSTLHYQLIQNDGQWKILNIRIEDAAAK